MSSSHELSQTRLPLSCTLAMLVLDGRLWLCSHCDCSSMNCAPVVLRLIHDDVGPSSGHVGREANVAVRHDVGVVHAHLVGYVDHPVGVALPASGDESPV